MKKRKMNSLKKFIHRTGGQELAPGVHLLSNRVDSGPYELPMVTRSSFLSWLVAGALSFLVFTGLNVGQADAFSQKAESNNEQGTLPVHQISDYISMPSHTGDSPPVVVASDCIIPENEIQNARVHLVKNTGDELINNSGEIEQRFAHNNVTFVPHTNVAHTNVPWGNWTDVNTHVNIPWSNISIDPGVPGGGGGILF
ncbi:MAG: hypothetical protein J7M18_02135 [Candidatus Eremiobacteraeota bacterium]|nr:hypothetical protein [Candidatus Eremiobacteraeota bacterium]